MSNAMAAYKEELARTEALLTKIERVRSYRNGQAYIDKPDFADVGDWQYVNSVLEEALGFLIGEDNV
jgi:hypothetical protein